MTWYTWLFQMKIKLRHIGQTQWIQWEFNFHLSNWLKWIFVLNCLILKNLNWRIFFLLVIVKNTLSFYFLFFFFFFSFSILKFCQIFVAFATLKYGKLLFTFNDGKKQMCIKFYFFLFIFNKNFRDSFCSLYVSLPSTFFFFFGLHHIYDYYAKMKILILRHWWWSSVNIQMKWMVNWTNSFFLSRYKVYFFLCVFVWTAIFFN